MYRFLIVPLLVGVLAFVLIFVLSPALTSESDTVAFVARVALALSNLFYDTMPPAIADYINNLTLGKAAFTVALILTVTFEALAIVFSALSY